MNCFYKNFGLCLGISTCYGLKYVPSPQNSYIEVLTPNMSEYDIFVDWVFKGVIRLKLSY